MKPRIITHSGKFHPDELLACVVLLGTVLESMHKFLFVAGGGLRVPCAEHWSYGDTSRFPAGRGLIIRTRDEEIIREGLRDPDVFVVDVGHVYDPDMGNFDHHQDQSPEPRENRVPYSSFGLVWRKYGGAFCAKVLKVDETSSLAIDVAEALDKSFVQGVDAVDNGAVDFKTSLKGTTDPIRLFGLSGRVALYNAAEFGEGGVDADGFLADTSNFLEALDDLGGDLLRMVRLEGMIQATARTAVTEGYRPQQRLIVLDEFCHGWQRYADECAPEALFCLYPNDGSIRVQSVPMREGSFSKKKPLPEKWGPLDMEDLAEITGVSDAVFCHKGLWICGARSLEGAMEMARLAVAA